ncbi:MAG: hypothetical protein WA985_02180 [Erythrobacter sp.]
MSKIDWNKVGQSNADPAGYNPDRNFRFAPFKAGSKPGMPKKLSRIATGPRKMLADVLNASPRSDLKRIGKRIEIIEQSGKPDANSFIHQTAIMILEHAKGTGDCSAALDLIRALPAGGRRARLALWFRAYSPICYNAQTGRIRVAKRGQKAFKCYAIDRASRSSFR